MKTQPVPEPSRSTTIGRRLSALAGAQGDDLRYRHAETRFSVRKSEFLVGSPARDVHCDRELPFVGDEETVLVERSTVDAIVVGGGPAGTTCARVLCEAGAHVALIDRASFPRVKLCAGWLSPAIWDVLTLTPRQYSGELWEWQRCHVRYRDKDHAIPCRGWFIRRYELDDFLLRRSGAELHLGIGVKQIERDGDGVWSIAGLQSRVLIGAGGTHCPVARRLAPVRPSPPVGVQELELQTDAAGVARTRIGEDGEPELVLFDDSAGYGWNVAKSDWINVGCGTLDANDVRTAWSSTHNYLRAAGHLPDEAEPALAHVKGHSYYLFDPVHLEHAAHVDGDGRGGAFLVGDALGLAHPVTAEGILPAAISGRHLAEALVAGKPASYVDRLRRDPVLADYRRVRAALTAAHAVRQRWTATHFDPPFAHHAIARAFAWMFSGARLPAPWLVDRLLARAARATAAAL
jgi:flavin-dependent dehydrogenase